MDPTLDSATPLTSLTPSSFDFGSLPGWNSNFSGAGGGGFFGDMSGMDKVSAGLAGLKTLGNLWNAFQAQKLAKQQFSFTKDITNTNLANQIKSYNTALSDRARSRAAVEGQSQGQMQSYIDQNSLSRNGG